MSTITKHFKPKKDYAAIRVINTRRAAKAHAEEGNQMDANTDEAGTSADTSNDRVKRSADNSSGTGPDTTPPMRGEAILPKGLPLLATRYTRTYNKQYNLRIFNELHKRQTYKRGLTKYNIFIPAFHELPVHMLGLYMRRDEVERLRYHTSVHAKKCDVKIHTNTAVTTFETNASNTNIGNNNVGIKFCELNPDVSKYRSGGYVNDQQSIIRSIFWGRNPAALKDEDTPTTDFAGIGAEYILRNYDNKFRYTTVQKVAYTQIDYIDDSEAAMDIGENLFPINRHIKKRINASIDEGEFSNWSYTPTDGLLLGNYNYMIDLSGRTEDSFMRGLSKNQNNIHWRSYGGINNDADKKLDEDPMYRVPMEGHDMENYNENIFPANMNIHQDVFRNLTGNDIIPIDRWSGNGIGHTRMPVCGFGFDPFISINTKDGVATAAKAHIDLIVETSITIECQIGADGQDQAAYTMSEWDQINVPTMLYSMGDQTRVEENFNFTTKHPHEKLFTSWNCRAPYANNDIIVEPKLQKPEPAKIPSWVSKGWKKIKEKLFIKNRTHLKQTFKEYPKAANALVNMVDVLHVPNISIKKVRNNYFLTSN